MTHVAGVDARPTERERAPALVDSEGREREASTGREGGDSDDADEREEGELDVNLALEEAAISLES